MSWQIFLVWIGIIVISSFSLALYTFLKDTSVNKTLEEIDLLDGISFEHFVAQLLRKNGYSNVTVTKASGDFGIDVLGRKDNKLWAFQCKCYSSSIGVHAVQEVYSGSQKYKADIPVVITNSYFTAAAKEMATDLSVLLWDRNKLASLLPAKNEDHQKERQTVDTHTYRSSPTQISKCVEHSSQRDYVVLQKNQLPNGKYLVGRDIPAGIYDFTWIFGNGSIMKFKNDHDTTLGATTYFQHIGDKYDYEYKQCLNVHCEEGELIDIDGNVVVQIAKSQKVQIDL